MIESRAAEVCDTCVGRIISLNLDVHMFTKLILNKPISGLFYCGSRLGISITMASMLAACDSGAVSGSSSGIEGLPVANTGGESIFADTANLDIGGDELLYAPFCGEEPFDSDTVGTYTGVISHEVFSEFSRCEYEITLNIETSGADNQFCEQSGVLSFEGRQTVVSEFSNACGSGSDLPVTIGWALDEHSQPASDGSRIELIREIEFPLEAVVNTWDIEQFPEVNSDGVQVEYPIVLFSLVLNQDMTISGGDDELYGGKLIKSK